MVRQPLPPDPNPKTPRLKCPPGTIDAHVHIYGPRDKYPQAPDSAVLVEDALPETVMAMHKTLGISAGVFVSGGAYGRTYHHLLDVLKAYPHFSRGVAVPPDNLIDDEIKLMHAGGVRGVRFSSNQRVRNSAPILPDLAKKIADWNWHVQFYAPPGGLAESVEALMALPNDIVIDHFGTIIAAEGLQQPSFQALLRMLDSGRVWVKMSGPMRCSEQDPPYADLLPFAHALVKHAPERLVWGTDWPHPFMFDMMPNDGDLLDMLLEQVPDEATRKIILVDNPRKLYDLGPV